jgi:hypothetical protein
MPRSMVGLLAVHAAANSTDSQLIMATWGLVLATFLLFLASIVPAVGQFRDWSGKKKAVASTVIPLLHAARSNTTWLLDELLSTDTSEKENNEHLYNAAVNHSHFYSKLDDIPGLSLDQRLEMTILRRQLGAIGSAMSFVAHGDPDNESDLSAEEHLRRATIFAKATLISMDRADRLFTRFRKGSYADEMMSYFDKDFDEAEKQLVDIRRKRREQSQK